MPPRKTISFSPDDVHECVAYLFPPEAAEVAEPYLDKPEDITLEQCVRSDKAMMAKVQ